MEVVLRNTVKALVEREGAILFLEKAHGGETSYTLPGGAQHPGEALIQALQRECREEIATEVETGPLRFIYEHERTSRMRGRPPRHKVEFVFTCRVPAGYEPRPGPKPDPHQIGVVWIDRRDLGRITLSPPALAGLLGESKGPEASLYRGWLTP